LKNIVLCTNPRRDFDFSLTLAIYKLLIASGVKPQNTILFPSSETVLPEEMEFVTLSEALKGAELLICLGGDGTILHAAKAAAINFVPTLGINIGRKGFLADLEATDYEKVSDAICGNYTIDERMMLCARVEREGKVIYQDFALNDAVVARGNVNRTIELSVFGDGKKISSILGDGLIVATPTGSTAYSMSAGGPIVEPSASALVVTPICAHDLRAKSFVLSSEAEVTIEIGELSDEKTSYLSLDGPELAQLKSGDKVKITKSVYKTQLVRVLNRSFYEIVNQKLGSID
jgi:NAD+ kinase